MLSFMSMPHNEVEVCRLAPPQLARNISLADEKEVSHMYAIIVTGGKQYKVSEGDVLKVEKLDVEPGATVTFDQVVAISDNELKVAGDVKGASVTATVVAQGKHRKVIVYKYKRKTGYHKKNGHRQAYTQVKIEKINA